MSIPELISGISLGSAYVRPGTEGAITSVSFIAGGWITVDSFGDLTTIDHSRTSTGQIAFVSQSQQFYIAKKIPADFETTFDNSVAWSKFTFSGSFSGSFSGDGSGLTGVAAAPAGNDKTVQFRSGSSTRGAVDFVYDHVTGRVGIGTVSPSAKLEVAGDLVVTGKITAEEFHTEFVSASIIFQSGSTKFGNSADDNHMFTGTVNITGSVIAPRFSGSFSGSFEGDGSNLTGIASSLAISGSTGTDVINLKTESLTITGSARNISVAVTNNTATISVASDLTLTSVNLTGSFSGPLTGNATTATTASHAVSALSASHAIGYVKDGGGLANEVMVWKDGETASGSQALRFNTVGATLNVTGNVTATSFTGSFSGSFSGAVANAVTASFALNALSASYAATASSADAFIVRNTLIASGLTYPIADGLENQYIQTNGTGTLSFNDVHTLLEDVRSGEAITKGDPLYISGSLGAKPIVYKADAGVPAKMPVIYIALETASSGSDTRGIVLGLIEGIDTTGYPTGTEIYVAVGGGWTSTRPTGTATVQSLGYITKEGAGGKGIILNPGPFNLPNLQKDYVWKGNANGVPVAVASSSLIVTQALNATSASFALTAGSAATATSASFATSANTATSASHAIFANTAGTATTATSASFATFANTATSASHAIFANTAGTATTATSASFATFANTAGTATLATTATTALTASSADSFTVRNSATIVGDLVVGGKVTAEEFHTEFVSASIIFQSGSTIFGNSSDDVHQFTGSVNISHQLYAGLDSEVRPQVVGYNTSTGELTYFNSSSILATAIPGGTNQQVQYNNNGVTAGASGFVWNGTNVGIGSASPGYKLEVNGTQRVVGNLYLYNTVTNVASNFTNQRGLGFDASTGATEIAASTVALQLSRFSTTGDVLAIRHSGSVVSSLGTDGGASFTGNVGIGTTGPAGKLHVQDTNGGLFFDGSGATYNRFKSTTSSAAVGRDLLLSTQNSGTTPDLYITSTGNVGIGTTGPTKSLHVVGGVRFSSYGAGSITGTATKTLAVNSSGEVIELDVSSNGTGVADQVAFWKDTDTVSGSAALTWNGSTFYINGTLEATEKSFVIDHPTLPGKRLVYGVLEGPEHAVYCRGKISGEVINLPEEWTGLVDSESITVQLTPIGRHQNLYVVDINNNQVLIRNGDLLSSKINAYYFIQATRKDVKPLATVREA